MPDPAKMWDLQGRRDLASAGAAGKELHWRKVDGQVLVRVAAVASSPGLAFRASFRADRGPVVRELRSLH